MAAIGQPVLVKYQRQFSPPSASCSDTGGEHCSLTNSTSITELQNLSKAVYRMPCQLNRMECLWSSLYTCTIRLKPTVKIFLSCHGDERATQLTDRRRTSQQSRLFLFITIRIENRLKKNWPLAFWINIVWLAVQFLCESTILNWVQLRSP